MSRIFSSVLIANRGEIACRVIRTAKRMGLRTIAVYSSADAKAPHVRLADEAHHIGPPPAAESYLRADRIIEVAQASRAAAIHPGYGFLSENAEFAEACAEAGIIFVGPPASAIRAMGLKDAAKALVEKAGVAVVPGYHGPRQEPDFLRQKAYETGYPVLIKAIAGGGGKGMRRVERQQDFDAALASAQREAMSAFGDPRVLIEKYIPSPRHIEMQVFADAHGHVLHLFERDCSLQRRHQKVIEEAPAPGMTPEVRRAMGEAAVEAARVAGYIGAGTVEFIADGRGALRADGFYFMEMNTRLQVEHPVTEAITGLDLVEWQLRVAAGDALPFDQEDLVIDGHAVEARLYAEDPEKGFLPSTGKLIALKLPTGEGVRIDSGVAEGDEVTPFYDPMIAKIIAHGVSREQALEQLSGALTSTIVAGPKCNLAFLKALVDADEFREGAVDTGFIERNLENLGAVPQPADTQAIAAGTAQLLRMEYERSNPSLIVRGRLGSHEWLFDPWSARKGFELAGRRHTVVPVATENGRANVDLFFDEGGPRLLAPGEEAEGWPDVEWNATLRLAELGDGNGAVVRGVDKVFVIRNGRQTSVALVDPLDVDLEHLDGDAGGQITSPMHGKLVALLVNEGDEVAKGQLLAVVEAMKMEHALTAPVAGVVSEVLARVGEQVGEGARLLTVVAHEQG
ncbi:MAG: biotin/lipoyl-binding protein [Hyphomicrobiales bacterium]|nr:biotin/lipoyl-binding protein [Hyphomicrobiales bacterium]MBV9519157.1 biotin/lipoyl-binding protein [Hyphomicrobiales bacterium]